MSGGLLELARCPICLDAFTSAMPLVVSTRCGHTFCKKCADKHLTTSGTCALCKAPFSKRNMCKLFVDFGWFDGQDFESVETPRSIVLRPMSKSFLDKVKRTSSSINLLAMSDPGDLPTQVDSRSWAFVQAGRLLQEVADHAGGDEEVKDAIRCLSEAVTNVQKYHAGVLSLAYESRTRDEAYRAQLNEGEERHLASYHRQSEIIHLQRSRLTDYDDKLERLKKELVQERSFREELEEENNALMDNVGLWQNTAAMHENECARMSSEILRFKAERNSMNSLRRSSRLNRRDTAVTGQSSTPPPVIHERKAKVPVHRTLKRKSTGDRELDSVRLRSVEFLSDITELNRANRSLIDDTASPSTHRRRTCR